MSTPRVGRERSSELEDIDSDHHGDDMKTAGTGRHDAAAAAERPSAKRSADGRDRGRSALSARGHSGAIARRSAQQLRKYGLLYLLVLIVIFFSILIPSSFATVSNMQSMMTGAAPQALVALGVMLPLVVQQYDLSVGYTATMASLLTIGLMSRDGMSMWLALAVGIAASLVIGAVNGGLIAYGRLNSLVVTLGTGSLLTGVALLYSGGQLISSGIPAAFTQLGQGKFLGMPLPFVYTVVGFLIAWYILSYRVSGRHLYAIGGNEEAARLAGVHVRRLTFLALTFGALAAGLGGIMQSTRVGSADATSLTSLLLPAFAAAFLSITVVRPGHFNVWGTLIAVYIVSIGSTGMFMLGAPTYVQPVFNGVVLIIAIALFTITSRKNRHA
jgi:ribose transport system permease protein